MWNTILNIHRYIFNISIDLTYLVVGYFFWFRSRISVNIFNCFVNFNWLHAKLILFFFFLNLLKDGLANTFLWSHIIQVLFIFNVKSIVHFEEIFNLKKEIDVIWTSNLSIFFFNILLSKKKLLIKKISKSFLNNISLISQYQYSFVSIDFYTAIQHHIKMKR